MGNNITKILFALLRSALKNEELSNDIKAEFNTEILSDVIKLAAAHDLLHLVAVAMINNNLIDENAPEYQMLKKSWFMAVKRYELQNSVLLELCEVLEEAEIEFIPLKGSVLRKYYPEPWMRTSCDIDVLVHTEDVNKTINYLVKTKGYVKRDRTTHDVSLFTNKNVHIEIHFDLVEEGRANNANDVLKSVWDNVSLKSGHKYLYEMSDQYFYFYHIAHMAKHIEKGGCGIRTFVDLWILNSIGNVDENKRYDILKSGGLVRFEEVSKKLSMHWIENEPIDETVEKMQSLILTGGAFGTTYNRVALQQKRSGGKIGYLLSRMFIPYAKLKRYYPILETHSWLTPVMQIRRWFMLLNPNVVNMAKSEITLNQKSDNFNDMDTFLEDIGIL